MDWSSKDSVCLKILSLGGVQEDEEKALHGLLWDDANPGTPEMSKSSLAMAFAGYFYRGTTWLFERQNEILSTILQSPEAAYVALYSGFYRGDVKALCDKIGENPRLTLDVLQNPALCRIVKSESLIDTLNGHPLQKAIWLFLQGKSEDAINLIVQAAGLNPNCAGVCLGLDPGNERADDWLAVMAGSAESFYWLGKVWIEGKNHIETHPYWPVASAELRRDPRWFYHHVRDVAPNQASSGLDHLGFSPWGVELAVDLGVPMGSVLDLYFDTTLDPKQSLDSALILWATHNSLSIAS